MDWRFFSNNKILFSRRFVKPDIFNLKKKPSGRGAYPMVPRAAVGGRGNARGDFGGGGAQLKRRGGQAATCLGGIDRRLGRRRVVQCGAAV